MSKNASARRVLHYGAYQPRIKLMGADPAISEQIR